MYINLCILCMYMYMCSCMAPGQEARGLRRDHPRGRAANACVVGFNNNKLIVCICCLNTRKENRQLQKITTHKHKNKYKQTKEQLTNTAY